MSRKKFHLSIFALSINSAMSTTNSIAGELTTSQTRFADNKSMSMDLLADYSTN